MSIFMHISRRSRRDTFSKQYTLERVLYEFLIKYLFLINKETQFKIINVK